MAREVVVSLGDEESRFAIARLTRDKVYGKKRRVVVDSAGDACGPAKLTVDGTTVLGNGSTSLLYIDGEFNGLSKAVLVPFDPATGETLPAVASTLGTSCDLVGPIDVRRFLDHAASAIYELDATELGEKLKEGLAAGGIFESKFNYSKGLVEKPLFLLQTEAGVFGVVGEFADFAYCRPDEPAPVEEGDDPFDDDDDLDFGMF